MEGFLELCRGKKVTLLGLGSLGRGVGDAEFLLENGAILTVTDKKTERDLGESMERLKKYSNVTFHLGGHRIEDFTSADFVIKAAGVPLDSPEIAAARKTGVPVYMSSALFAKYAAEKGAIIVGITGTRGKSTIAHMIHHTLTKAGKRSHLGGNVRGLSTLALLPEIENGDIAVLELDSWQLQGFGDLQISPHISVFTNLMPDHQNYYPDMESYFSDKANIFRYQKEGDPSRQGRTEADVLIVGTSIAEKIAKSHPPVAAMTPVPIPEEWSLQIRGEHNRENASLAACALASLGLNLEEIKKGIESFSGVEGRLQMVREKDGIQIYNDNNATTPEATIAALKALDRGTLNIVLIAGGADKDLDLSPLVTQMQQSCKKVVYLSGSGTDRLAKWYPGPVFTNLRLAVREALSLSSEGDIILFSPGFASFGMFKNEYDRNDQFLSLAREL